MYMSLYVYMCACVHSIRKHQVGSLLAFTAALYQIESCIFELAKSNTAICHSGRYSTGRMSAALKKVSVAVL